MPKLKNVKILFIELIPVIPHMGEVLPFLDGDFFKRLEPRYTFRIFLCDVDNGFNYDEARKLGYNGFENFLMGKINNKSDVLSWIGSSNYSWHDVKEKLFTETVKDFSIGYHNANQTINTRMFPLSCFEILTQNKLIVVKSETPKVIYFSDSLIPSTIFSFST